MLLQARGRENRISFPASFPESISISFVFPISDLFIKVQMAHPNGQFCERYSMWCDENEETAHFTPIIAQTMVTNITAQTVSTYLIYTPSNFAIFTMIVGTYNKIDPNIYAIAIIFISTTKIPNTFKRKTIEKIKNVILMTLATDLFACFSFCTKTPPRSSISANLHMHFR